VRYRAVVAYDGTEFQGWQSQSGRGPTVQEALSKAFSTIVREPVHVVGAGRTDAGVHARGQVIAFDVEAELEEVRRIERSVNAVLPEAVAVRDLERASADFDPRRHAVRRAYQYRIWNDPVRCPFERRVAWHVETPLDHEAMHEAAQLFLGQHDFASYQGADKIDRPSVRRVERSEVARHGSLVTYWIEANAFARHMVRNIVGHLAEVGRGRSSCAQVAEILAALDRRIAPPPAPPEGLFLEWVRYR